MNDLDLPLDAILGLWSELEAARLGKNGFGGTAAEIYAYRCIPEGVASTQPSVGPRAAKNLTKILLMFLTRYSDYEIGFVQDDFVALDLAKEELSPFDWRIQIEVRKRMKISILDLAAKISLNPHEATASECLILARAVLAGQRAKVEQQPYRCNVPMCGDSGVCEECRKRGAR